MVFLSEPEFSLTKWNIRKCLLFYFWKAYQQHESWLCESWKIVLQLFWRNKDRPNSKFSIQFNSLSDCQIHSTASYTKHQGNNTMIFEVARYSGHAHWTTLCRTMPLTYQNHYQASHPVRTTKLDTLLKSNFLFTNDQAINSAQKYHQPNHRSLYHLLKASKNNKKTCWNSE